MRQAKEMDCAEVVEVIRMQFRAGKGTDDDPVRLVVQYRHKEGGLIVEFDGREVRTRWDEDGSIPV